MADAPMIPTAWYTDASTRCGAYDSTPYRNAVQCTRDRHDDPTHVSLWANWAWSDRPVHPMNEDEEPDRCEADHLDGGVCLRVLARDGSCPDQEDHA